MSQHQTVFTIEKTIPAAEAAPTLPLRSDPAPTGAPQPTEDASKHMRRRPLRKLLLDRREPPRGCRDIELRLAVLDSRPLRGLDRRRLRQGRQHDDRAEGLRLYCGGAGRRQRARSRPARSWPASTTATSRSRSSRPRPMSSPPRPASPTSRRRSLPSSPQIEAAQGDRRGRPGQPDLRRAGGPALRRSSPPRATAASRTRSRLPRGSPPPAPPCPRHRRARDRDQAARRAQGRARAGAGSARPRRARSSTRRS